MLSELKRGGFFILSRAVHMSACRDGGGNIDGHFLISDKTSNLLFFEQRLR